MSRTKSWLGNLCLARLAGLAGAAFVDGAHAELVLFALAEAVHNGLARLGIALGALGPRSLGALLALFHHVLLDGRAAVARRLAPRNLDVVAVPVDDVRLTGSARLVERILGDERLAHLQVGRLALLVERAHPKLVLLLGRELADLELIDQVRDGLDQTPFAARHVHLLDHVVLDGRAAVVARRLPRQHGRGVGHVADLERALGRARLVDHLDFDGHARLALAVRQEQLVLALVAALALLDLERCLLVVALAQHASSFEHLAVLFPRRLRYRKSWQRKTNKKYLYV